MFECLWKTDFRADAAMWGNAFERLLWLLTKNNRCPHLLLPPLPLQLPLPATDHWHRGGSPRCRWAWRRRGAGGRGRVEGRAAYARCARRGWAAATAADLRCFSTSSEKTSVESGTVTRGDGKLQHPFLPLAHNASLSGHFGAPVRAGRRGVRAQELTGTGGCWG